MPVAVRNLSKTNVVLSTLDKGQSVDWKPAGDLTGEDIQQVPNEFVNSNIGFLKAVGLGILAIEEDDAVLRESIERQAARYTGSAAKEKSEMEAVLDVASATGVIRISEDQIDRHIQSLSKSQPSDLSTLGEE